MPKWTGTVESGKFTYQEPYGFTTVYGWVELQHGKWDAYYCNADGANPVKGMTLQGAMKYVEAREKNDK